MVRLKWEFIFIFQLFVMLKNQQQLQVWCAYSNKQNKDSFRPFTMHRTCSVSLPAAWELSQPLHFLSPQATVKPGCEWVFLTLKQKSLAELTLPPYFTFFLPCCVLLIPMGWSVKDWLLLTLSSLRQRSASCLSTFFRLLLLHPLTSS